MIREFKAFIARGNMLDMAVGIIIGVAFGKIVTSLVEDVIMPPIGLLLGKVDFSGLYVNLSGTEYESLAKAREAGAAVIAYGSFINTIINFLIVAFAVFLLVKAANKLRAAEEPTTRECPHCLTKIAVGATRCPACTSDL